MIPQLSVLTSGMKLKAAIVSFMLLISPANGMSSLDIHSPALSINQPVINKPSIHDSIDIFKDNTLWNYLRSGINYVEASGEEVPVDFVHPGDVAYGPLALTRIAVKDVILHYKNMSDYTIDEVLSDNDLYEECGKLYADLLLRHYLKIKKGSISREQIFDILQRAWFLGPTIFKRGGKIPLSRKNNAREYIASARIY